MGPCSEDNLFIYFYGESQLQHIKNVYKYYSSVIEIEDAKSFQIQQNQKYTVKCEFPKIH